jgi:hypothetical protein
LIVQALRCSEDKDAKTNRKSPQNQVNDGSVHVPKINVLQKGGVATVPEG